MTPGPFSVPRLVIDTNWVLDLWVFNDPRTITLRQALEQRQVQWLACPAMYIELERVLGYPNVSKRLLKMERDAASILALFDQYAQMEDVPPSSHVRCEDPDDQVFINLAIQHQACILSKDLMVLKLNHHLQKYNISVSQEWL